MECEICKKEMVTRKAKRASYDAPEIYICTKCGRMLVKQGDEQKSLDKTSDFIRRN